MAALFSGIRQDNALDSLFKWGNSSPLVGSGLAETSVAMPTGAAAFEPSFMQNLTGYKLADGTAVNGWGGTALGALSGLGNMFMGMQNYGLAKDQLKFQKDAYNKNYAAQKQTTNASLEDRQRARVASNPTAYQSVSDYMAKNRIA